MRKKLIPKNVLNHCGQKAAQHAVWKDGGRVTKREWRALALLGPVDHKIMVNGQVVVNGARLCGWSGPLCEPPPGQQSGGGMNCEDVW